MFVIYLITAVILLIVLNVEAFSGKIQDPYTWLEYIKFTILAFIPILNSFILIFVLCVLIVECYTTVVKSNAVQNLYNKLNTPMIKKEKL